jgi:hypothetical protein
MADVTGEGIRWSPEFGERVEGGTFFVEGGDSLRAWASPSAGVRRLVWMPISPSSPRRPSRR